MRLDQKKLLERQIEAIEQTVDSIEKTESQVVELVEHVHLYRIEKKEVL